MKNAKIIALTLALAGSPAYAISWPTPSIPKLNGPNALKTALIVSATGLGYVVYKKGYVGQAVSIIKDTVRKHPKKTFALLATLSALLVANYYGYLDGVKEMVCNPFAKETETKTAIIETVTKGIETTVIQTPIKITETTTTEIKTTTQESITTGTPTTVSTRVDTTPVAKEIVVTDTTTTTASPTSTPPSAPAIVVTPAPDTTTTQSITPPAKTSAPNKNTPKPPVTTTGKKTNAKPPVTPPAKTAVTPKKGAVDPKALTTTTPANATGVDETKKTIVGEAFDSIRKMVDTVISPDGTPAPTSDQIRTEAANNTFLTATID